MGIIQNALNQMLGTVGVAARLSPGYETKQELHQLGKQEKALQAQRESFTEPPEPGTSDYRILEDVEEKGAEIKQKKFELKPTPENLKQAAITRPFKSKKYEPSMESLKLKSMISEGNRQEQAMTKVAEKQENKQTQKRNFKDYLGKLETSLGGTVSDLPKNVQKLIAKQYSSAERKSLMDKVDKESKK